MHDDNRVYVVGLPVVITVSPEGRVHAEVDFGDVKSAMHEDFAATDDYSDEQIDADGESVSAWVSGGAFRVVQ